MGSAQLPPARFQEAQHKPSSLAPQHSLQERESASVCSRPPRAGPTRLPSMPPGSGRDDQANIWKAVGMI